MKNGRDLARRVFWDLYDYAIPWLIVAIFWLAAGLPWLVAAMLLYSLYPGLNAGFLLMLPFLKFNPATFAFYEFAHRRLYLGETPAYREFWRAWPRHLGRSQLLLALLVVPAGLVLAEVRFYALGYFPRHWLVTSAILLNVLAYVLLLVCQIYYVPLEMFRKRPLRELAEQALVMTFAHPLVTLTTCVAGLFLAFGAIRFGVIGLLFIAVSAVLELELLYFVYGKHGKIPLRPVPERGWAELWKPFTGKVDE
jgi:uncharacterized membrane protein YesL